MRLMRARRFERTPEIQEALGVLTTAAPPARPQLTDRPLWLYGRGSLGRLAREYIKINGIPVAGEFERDEPAPAGAPVAVCVVTAPYAPIERVLRGRGYNPDTTPVLVIDETGTEIDPRDNV